MTPYSQGAAFERKVRDYLYEQGATLVVRSAGSHSPVDLVALTTSPGSKYGPVIELIQVKKDGKLYGKARKEFIALARSVDADAVLARAVKNGRRVDVVLEVLS